MIETTRLNLIPLSEFQLEKLLAQPSHVEAEIGIHICKDIIAGRVEKAIMMKLDNMKTAPLIHHEWFTYWLLVIKSIPLGTGLLGYKGYPDENGTIEIGYGIDPEHRSKGYMTEAVRELISWAFRHPECLRIVAPKTLKSNPASNRVLEKSGMQIFEETKEARSWQLDRIAYEQGLNP
jgi:[ribosomal protein S5]-alanine N-acetyltransferase